MGFFGLSGPRLAAFVVMTLVGLALLGYVGGLLGRGADRAQVEPSPRPTPAPSTAIAPCGQPPASQPAAPATLYEAGVIELEAGVAPAGLAYLPGARTLAVAQATDEDVRLVSSTLYGDSAGTLAIDVERADHLAAGAAATSPLVVLDKAQQSLRVLLRNESGAVDSVHGSIDLRGADVGDVAGMGVDPDGETVVLLDATRDRLLRIGLDGLAGGPVHISQLAGACDVQVPGVASGSTLLAVRPTDGHVFLATLTDTVLHELDRAGQAIGQVDLGDAGLASVTAMAFAPSADPNDAEDVLHLHFLESDPSNPRIRTLSFSPPATTPAAVPELTGSIVTRISTAALNPPSSDPGGIAYDPARDRLIVTDSDIDELPDFAGHVVFALEANGTWVGLGQPRGAIEITDVAIDAGSDRWFFTDDSDATIIQVELGDDGQFGTRDDRISTISTTAFGNSDPEGVAFGQGSLFVTDGAATRVYRLTPGPDGEFNGVPPAGDDRVTSFDTAALGISDPEALAFDPNRGTLYVLSRDRREPIVEVATDGTLMTVIAIDRDELNSPGGLTLAPALDGSGRLSLFIADRGEDNARSDVPNDGMLLEVQVDSPAAGLNRSRGALPPGSTGRS
ncbi:MAG: hypothetical protein ACRDGB_00995 [Candidatus Limnocylindria bacterium]